MPDTDPSARPSPPAMAMTDMMAMEDLGGDRFRNLHNQPNSNRTLFGGQIVAQALAAADRTVPDRAAHSLHAYFIRAGSADMPVEFAVERTRDGGRFSTRRVVARQKDITLFSMECSYRVPLRGFSHQKEPLGTTDPEGSIDINEIVDPVAHPRAPYFFDGRFPIDIRVPDVDFLNRRGYFHRNFWLRARGAETLDDPAVHRQILAFMSDFMLPATGLAYHTSPLPGPEIFVASLDHAMWFHRPVRCDDWLLFETESPNSEGGVSLARGSVYDRNGLLVASLAQETLHLPRDL